MYRWIDRCICTRRVNPIHIYICIYNGAGPRRCRKAGAPGTARASRRGEDR